jgi:hypothetical protein
VEKDEITFTVKIVVFSAPGLEMRITIATSSAGAACSRVCIAFAICATVVVDVVSVIAFFTGVEDSVAASRSTIGDRFIDASGLWATAGAAVIGRAVALPSVDWIYAARSIFDGEKNLGVDCASGGNRDTDFIRISTLVTYIEISRRV